MAHLSRARKIASDAEVRRAVELELRSGIKLKEALEHEREIVAAHEASLNRDVQRAKSMKHIGEMPQWEYHNLCNKYGHEEVHSKGFWQYYQKHFPHLATAKV